MSSQATAGALTGLRGTLLSTVSAVAMGAVSGIALARTLAPAERGELAAILLWPVAIGILGNLGLGWAFSYHVARDRSLLSGLWTFGWIVSLGWGTVLAAAAHFLLARTLLLSVPARDALAFTLATVPFTLATGLQCFLLLGVGALGAFNAIRAIGVGLYAAGVLGIALSGEAGVLAYAGAWIASEVLTFASATAWLAFTRRPRWEWRPGLLRPVALYGAKTYVSSLSAQMTLRLDQLLMTALGAPSMLGVYVVAVAAASTTAPLFTALAILVMHRLQGGTPAEAGRGVLEFLQLAFLLGVPASLLLAAAVPWLLPAVFGAAYRGAVLPAVLLLAAGVFQGANAILGNGLRAIGLPGRPARAEAAGLVLTLGLLALFLPRFGAVGAAVASLLAYAAVTAIQTAFLCRAAGLAAREVPSVDLRRVGANLGALFGHK